MRKLFISIALFSTLLFSQGNGFGLTPEFGDYNDMVDSSKEQQEKASSNKTVSVNRTPPAQKTFTKLFTQIKVEYVTEQNKKQLKSAYTNYTIVGSVKNTVTSYTQSDLVNIAKKYPAHVVLVMSNKKGRAINYSYFFLKKPSL